MSKKFLVVGATGLIGQSVYTQLKNSNQNVIGTSFSKNSKDFRHLNLLDSSSVEGLEQENFTHLFFCANLAGGVNFCEQEPEIARRFHLQAPIQISEICRKKNAHYTFISTDYVFANHEGPVTEQESPNPLNYYGKLKYQAECEILKCHSNSLIVRTTNVYGLDRETKTPNFFMQVLRAMEKKEKINVSQALKCTPTYAPDLASGLIELAEKNTAGIFHMVGDDYLTRFEWAMFILKRFKWDERLIVPTREASFIPARPTELRLSTEKLRKYLKRDLISLDTGLSLIEKII